MATITATDLNGGTHGVQLQEKGDFTQIVTATLPSTLAQNDIITGPSIPAGASVVDVMVDVTDIDTNGSPAVAFTVGIAGSTAKFIGTNTAGRAGGIARMDVAAALGYTPTSDTPVIVTITAAAATAAAGTMKIGLTCTRNP